MSAGLGAMTAFVAHLLWRVVRESFLKGEAAGRPLIARHGLAASFVDPACALLGPRGPPPEGAPPHRGDWNFCIVCVSVLF